MPNARYAHQINPQDYYMQDPDTLLWNVESQVETAPAGTAIVTRRAKYITQFYQPGPDPEDPQEGEVEEISVAGYQQVQASPDTIAVYLGEFTYTLQAIYQQWVHGEVWNDTFQYWERPQPVAKTNEILYDPNDPTRVIGVEYTADYGGGNYLKTKINYNWFTGKVNKHSYELYWPGALKRVYTQLQIYDSTRFHMDLSDFDGPYDLVEQAGLTNVTYYPDGVSEDYCYVDPYIGVDEQSGYIDVLCDGFTLRVFTTDIVTTNTASFIAGNSTRFDVEYILEPTYNNNAHYLGNDPNKSATLISNGPIKVVIHIVAQFTDNGGVGLVDDGGNPIIANLILEVYDDLVCSFAYGEIIGTVELNNDIDKNVLPIYDGKNLSNTGHFKLDDTQETPVSTGYDGGLDNAIGCKNTRLNAFLADFYHIHTGTAIYLHRIDSTNELQCGFYNGTATGKWIVATAFSADDYSRKNDSGSWKTWSSGVTYARNEIVVDSNDIRWISKQDNNLGNTPPATGGTSAWWMEHRKQGAITLKHHQLTTLEQLINDLNIPLSVDNYGHASDAAFHSEQNAQNKSTLEYDIERIKPKHKLHFPFQIGNPGSPTNLLSAYYNFDDYASNSTVTDIENGVNGNWINVSDGASRNTDTPGDSVIVGGRNRSLSCQAIACLGLPYGGGTIFDQSFMQKGSVIIKATPLFALGSSKVLWSIHANTNNYITLQALASNIWRLTVAWGSTTLSIDSPVFVNTKELHRQSVFQINWDASQDFFELSIDSVVVDRVSHSGIPDAVEPIGHIIGANYNRSLPMEVILHSAKFSSQNILNYGGGPFVSNDGTDFSNAHKEVLFHWDCEVLGVGGVNIPSGNNILGYSTSRLIDFDKIAGQYAFDTNDAGNAYSQITNYDIFDLRKGSFSFWAKIITLPTSGTQFLATGHFGTDDYVGFEIQNTGEVRGTYRLNGTTSGYRFPTGIFVNAGEWHHYKIVFADASNGAFCNVYVDGREGSTSLIPTENAPIQGLGDGWLYLGGNSQTPDIHSYFDQVYVTNEMLTPDLWSSFGIPLHLPIVNTI